MIDKYKLTATLVKAFFDGYSSGIVDSHVTDVHEKYKPYTIKRVMLEHYESLFPVFHSLMLTAMAVMNFSYEEAEALFLKEARRGSSAERLLKCACGSEELYQALVEEYKRNFSDLLAGRRATVQQHMLSYTHGEETGSDRVDTETALRQTVRMSMRAYAKGIRAAKTGKATLHQPTVFRLIADALGTLALNGSGTDTIRVHSVGEYFLRLCGSRHNLAVMNEAINETYAELVEQEGIIAADDKSN